MVGSVMFKPEIRDMEEWRCGREMWVMTASSVLYWTWVYWVMTASSVPYWTWVYCSNWSSRV